MRLLSGDFRDTRRARWKSGSLKTWFQKYHQPKGKSPSPAFSIPEKIHQYPPPFESRAGGGVGCAQKKRRDRGMGKTTKETGERPARTKEEGG